MERKSPRDDRHPAGGGKLVPFAGWLRPVQYSGVIAEHRAVRTGCCLFDVSHMGELLLRGPDALANLNRLMTNDFSGMADGRVYLPRRRGGVRPAVEWPKAGLPAGLSDPRRNRLTAGDAARYIACPELDELADTLDAILSDSGLRRQVQGCCLRRVERWKTPDDNLRTRE